MAQPFQFDKAVLQVVADDKQMIETLKRDEAVVNRSVTKMQGNLNKLTVSMGTTGDAGRVAATGVTALSAAASATGSSTLMAGAAIANMGMAFNFMGSEALGAKDQLIALVVATKAYIVANLAAVSVLAALAAAIIAVRVLKGRAAKKELDELKRLEGESNKQITRFEKELKHRQGIAAITDKIAVAEGRLSKEEARLNELRRADRGAAIGQLEERVAAETRLADVLAANAAKLAKATATTAAQARETAEQQAQANKLAALRDQLAVLQGTKTQYDLIADAEERALKIAIDRTVEEKRITDEISRRHEARFVTPFEARGVATAAEAERLVMSTLGLVEANQRSAALTTAAFNRLAAQAARFGLDQEQLAKLRQTLGVEPKTRFGAGALAISGFAATGTKGIAGLSGAERQREQREQTRTTNSDAIAANTERLAIAFDRWQPMGAG